MSFLPLCASALRLLPQRARPRQANVEPEGKENKDLHANGDKPKEKEEEWPALSLMPPWRRKRASKPIETIENKENIEEQANDETSRASTDVLEESAESDDLHTAGSKWSEQSDEGPDDSSTDVPVDRNPSSKDAAADKKALAPWRRSATSKTENKVGSSDAETNEENAAISSESVPLTARSDQSWEEHPKSVAVLRWDAETGRWIPEQIEITEPPHLPRFAMAFSNGAEANPCEDDKQIAQFLHPGAAAFRAASSARVLNQDAAVFVPGGKGGTKTLNMDAAVFVPGQDGVETTSFNLDAQEFVPGQEEEETADYWLDSLDYDEDGADMWASNYNWNAQAYTPSYYRSTPWRSSRTRLNSHAAAYVPCWDAYHDD